MDSSKLNDPASGVASIKAEFLQQDHVRKLNLDFVAARDKKRDAPTDDSEDILPKKKKLKGQNKHRPRNKTTPRAEKLCFKIGAEGHCPFGFSCAYSHNVDKYLATKPPDIGPTCYLYEIFGKCPYSFSCRFASNHIKDGKIMVLEQVYEKYKNKKLVTNFLTKDLQFSLRKHQYNFKKSDEISNDYNHLVNDATVIGQKTNSTVIEESNGTGIQSEEQKNNGLKESVSEQAIDPCEKSLSEQNTTSDALPIKKESTTDLPCTSLENVQSVDDLLCETKVSEQASDPCEKSSSEQNTTSDALPIKKESTTDLPCTSLKNNQSLDDLLFETEVKQIDFTNKLYLAPLTTVGNLPFRRICKEFGADITCSEMALSLSLLQGQNSEWALIRRHHTEDIYGIQLCGFNQAVMTRCCQVLSENASFDFIDINMGCPLDAIYKKGAGCGLMNRLKKLEGIVYGVSSVINVPLTLKMRTGIYANAHLADNVIARIKQLKNSVSLITLHGRSREQRYTKSADWDYIDTCTKIADPIPMFGNGDILSYEDYNLRKKETGVSGVMIARGALIKPWIFKEIKDQSHWDISAIERLDILRNFVNYGLEHWGSDTEGVEKIRRFLLEWLSFLYRYIPVGLLERLPQRINERPPPYFGRNELETLMASPSCSDWIKISELLLGPVPADFNFLPKHKANAYK